MIYDIKTNTFTTKKHKISTDTIKTDDIKDQLPQDVDVRIISNTEALFSRDLTAQEQQKIKDLFTSKGY